MTTDLLSKLKTYSALAGATAVAGYAHGQIKHTDLNPDSVFTGHGQYDLDLNNDLAPDFRLRIDTVKKMTAGTASTLFQTNDTIEIQPLGAGKSFISNGTSYAKAMVNGSSIASSGSWATSSQYLGIYFRFFIIGSISTGITTTYGSWQNKSNAYLGLRLIAGTDTTYGWARLSANANLSKLTLKDYAFQSWPNITIKAGDTTNTYAQLASNVAAADVANNGNGLDLEVSFTKAASEVGIKEYRIYVVKSSKAANFNIDTAKTIAPANYTVHVPNGSNYQSVLTAVSKDTDGNGIINNLPYKVFVLSVPDGSNTNAPSMVGPSNEVTLVPNTSIQELQELGLSFRQTDQKIELYNNKLTSNANVKLVATSGQVVFDQSINGNSLDIPTSKLASGVYVMSVKADNRLITHKFVVR